MIVVSTSHLIVSFQSTLKDSPFPKGFKGRFQKVVESLEWFLDKPQVNKFSKHYPSRPHYSLNVTLCGDQKMRNLNHQFRNKDKTTDVLTLALYDNIRGGEEMLFEEVVLGDIFVSAPVMKKQAKEYKVTVENEFYHLLIHGFLHLLGFDHEISPSEQDLMEAHEKRLIKKVHEQVI